MSQGSRSNLLSTMLLPMAMIIGIAGASQAANSELERELQRELHRMPPPALLPTPGDARLLRTPRQDFALRAAADPIRAGAMRDR